MSGKQPLVVAGIDVGGKRKGLHAVALRDGRYLSKCSATEPSDIVSWCRDEVHAVVIAIDAPSHWSVDGRARLAERELMSEGIWCFATPTFESAMQHPTNHYEWMIQGDSLFRALNPSHPLANNLPLPSGKQRCFETFPHAITCALIGARFGKKQAY